MRDAGLDEAQAGIKTARRNINKLRHADDTTLMAGSKKELKSILMKLKEENENAGLKLIFRKLSQGHPVPSLHGKWGNNRNSDRLNFLRLQNHCRW